MYGPGASTQYERQRYQPPMDLISRLLSQVGPAQGARRADTFQDGFTPPVQDWQQPHLRPELPELAGGRPYGGQEQSFGPRVDPGMIVPRVGGQPQMQAVTPGGQFDPIIAAIQRLLALQSAPRHTF